MIKILVITHGQLGTEIIQTAETIVGKQEDVLTLTLSPEESLASLCQRTEELLKAQATPEGILIMTDMLGGTPCNACLPFCTVYTVEIVSGVNLYMLLSAFINRRQMSLEELVRKVLHDGAKSVANAKALFLQKMQ